MTSASPPAPRTIRAQIHETALARVTRMFSAGLADIFAECLQNARRAGAALVRISVDHAEDNARPATIAIADDGAGIEDPAVLLSYGLNGWPAHLVRREDAAGMGLLSLARRGCTVSSRPRDAYGRSGAGWTVRLEPAHFAGEAPAAVEPDDGAPRPHGAVIRFPADDRADAIRRAAEAAARHYPLPVILDGLPDSPPGGQTLERRDFLDRAVHVETWRGLHIGVFRNRHCVLRDPNLNFHGLTLDVDLPSVRSLFPARWDPFLDVENCPDLQFVLPARKELLQTPFLADMRRAALHAVFRAMADDVRPMPSFEVWLQAREAGIDIEPPPARLRPWRPDSADIHADREQTVSDPVHPPDLRMAVDLEPPASQALRRAANRAALDYRAFGSDKLLEGFDWYDRLDRITGLRFDAITDGAAVEITAAGSLAGDDDAPDRDHPRARNPDIPDRPDAIRATVAVESADGAVRTIDLDADLAFAGEPDIWVADAAPVVARSSDLSPDELAAVIHASYFVCSEDCEADSYETQAEQARDEARNLAVRTLCGVDDALRESLAAAATRHLAWLLPRARSARIEIAGNAVAVTLDNDAGETS